MLERNNIVNDVLLLKITLDYMTFTGNIHFDKVPDNDLGQLRVHVEICLQVKTKCP